MWEILLKIPYGKTTTYGQIAREIAAARGLAKIVGCAVCGSVKKAMVEEQLTRPVEWLSSMPQALGIRNHYRRPEEHGSDRWFNALGSRRFTQNACVVAERVEPVSCGTRPLGNVQLIEMARHLGRFWQQKTHNAHGKRVFATLGVLGKTVSNS